MKCARRGVRIAIVDDIKRDRRTKNVLAQTNTKTVSAPLPSTGLVGDQAPAEIFTVLDFDIVKNQIHLEEENFQLMQALNTMGQITNMQSQSGPIPGTLAIKTSTSTTAESTIVFQPDAGQVWQVIALSILPAGSGSYRGIANLYDGNNAVELFDKSGTGTAESLDYDTPIFISSDVYLRFTVVTVDTSLTLKAAVARVR